MGPAPALTQVYVQSVTSPQGGSELIGPNIYSTSRHHGGNPTRVIVWEIGYGSNPIATMNGTTVANAETRTIGYVKEGLNGLFIKMKAYSDLP